MIITNDFKLEYIYSGLFSTDKNWIHPAKTEITYEIIYVISGEVFIEEYGKKYHLQKKRPHYIGTPNRTFRLS